ncbi:ubiquitin-protein ligase E3C [Condylostylus longicornis]|uniref:ubiquitin-protein ligase E3C n=1 Tax=Condylostylus longicornis TaxID=2530218 RepID=UPI00244E438F|nr:ubiquitin-protein ligase E3C [Condylostylus longicornis]XP_055372355.1 ubiquitin-protein ligase E3C [Condylostylus longicornis]
MYSFDGDFRRRPIQNLGGKTTTSDRDEVIRKAQVEREKRNLLRQQNNGAIILQSYSRSFLHRQRKKRLEREKFDEFLKENNHLLQNENNLSVALRRLIFFYSPDKDCNRLVEVCQQIIKNPDRIIVNAVTDSIWLHRIKKLLNLCLTQLGVQNSNQTIPLRTLETFASGNYIIKYMQKETNLEDNDKISELREKFLKSLFDYLIQNGNYFKRIRIILENKCPPLDGETTQPPNQLCRALFEMILWPMQLVKNNEHMYCESFAKYILSPEFSEPIRYFILPSLATRRDFPFSQLINCLGSKLCNRNLQKMDIDDQELFTHSNNNNTKFVKNESNTELFSSFLLNSIFILDTDVLDQLGKDGISLGNYIKIISTISPKILNLPKSTLKQNTIDDLDDDGVSDDSDCEMAVLKSNPPLISSIETKTLLEIVNYLNSTARVKLICENVNKFIADPEILYSLCKLCHNLMVYNKNAIMIYELLYNLAFMPEFIRAIWYTLASQSAKQGFSSPLILISKGMVPKSEIEINRTIAFLATFCALFGRLLPTRHDGEFKREHSFQQDCYQGKSDKLMPFSIEEIVQLSKTLKEISLGLVELAFPETRSALNEHYRSVLGRSHSDDEKIKQKKQVWTNLLNVVVTVLNQIHARDLRMSFCPENHWTVLTLNLPLDKPTDLPLTRASRMRGIRPFQPIRDFTREDFENNDGPPISTKQIRSITILREIPFVVPFNQRVSILQGLIAADKIRVQGNLQGFLHGPSILLTVRRSHLYEDAYDKLRPENEPDLRHKFRVQFTNSLGLSEVGIDGGGLFREFLSELIKTAFDPNRGFFMITTDNRLYPNPGVADIVSDFEKHYYFMGRILGKAIYENLLVELPLAEFFLSKLAGKYSDVDVHQLASLDPELYKNLLSLKEYDGDVSELGLDFTVVSNDLGKTEIKDLKPNGKDIIVNSSNKIEYIQLMADYKLNKQIRQHCVAFRKGLSNVLPVEWLYMFSNKELQILISGAEIPIDSEDLQKHCKYGGEYSPDHPTIQCFWKVFDEFTDTQRRQLLKFVTSCSRPPLLGFKDLDPPFLIQNAGNEERLPTASTCTNLLKLPAFKTIEQMREKLLYAIQAEAGFDLS